MSDNKVQPPAPSVWRPQRGQLGPFLAPYTVREVLVHGPRGSGKSDCMLAAFLRGVGKGYGSHWRGLIFKRTIPETEPLFEKAKLFYQANCPTIKYITHPHKVFRWPTGEMLTIRNLLDDDSYGAIHGSEVGFTAFDELSNWENPTVYLKSLSLLRSSHPNVSQMLQCWSTTNPSGSGHGWILKRWKLHDKSNNMKPIYDDMDSEEFARWSKDPFVNIASRPRMSFFLDTRLNDIFMKANPTYLADIAAQADNPEIARAWVEGDWSIVSGGMWANMWDRRHHIVKPFPIPRGWKIDRSFDAGTATPFATLWFAESDGSDYKDATGVWRSSVKGDLFVIREYYGTTGQPNTGLKLTPQEVSKEIIEHEIEWELYGKVMDGPADTAIHAEVISGLNMAEMMSRPVRLDDGREVMGTTWLRSDKNAGARITGWNMIGQMLTNAVPVAGKPREQPGLFFFDWLKYTPNQIANAPRDPKCPEDLPKRGEFHLHDALRYRVLANGRPMTQGRTVGMH